MGALTLKPFSDESREWELFESEGLDLTDSFGVSLRLSVREDKIFLAEPWDIKTPWISDRGRLFFEGASKVTNDSSKHKVSWVNIFNQVQSVLYFLDHFKYKNFQLNNQTLSFVFRHSNVETINMLSTLERQISCIRVFAEKPFLGKVNLESDYQVDSAFSMPKLIYSSSILLIGTNTRYEGYLVNLALRQRFLKGNFNIFNIGPDLALTLPSRNVGSTITALKSMVEGTSPFCQSLGKALLPMILINTEFFKRSGASRLTQLLETLKPKINQHSPTSVMSDSISLTGASSLKNFKGFTPRNFADSLAIYCVNCDIDASKNFTKLLSLKQLGLTKFNLEVDNESKLVFDQSLKRNNEFENVLASSYDRHLYLHLPSKSVFEENSTYVTALGVNKKSVKVLNSQFGTKSNWLLLRYLSSTIKNSFYFANKKDLNMITDNLSNQSSQNSYSHFFYQATPSLTSLSCYLDVKPFTMSNNNKALIANFNRFKSLPFQLKRSKIKYWLDDFFIGGGRDCLSTSSKTLISSSKSIRVATTNFF